MLEALAWVLGLIAFLIVLAVSIGLHEGGHMAVAKMFKLSVPKFFIGFGSTLWSKKIGPTEYGVKAIPLGGFVQIEDETRDLGSPDRQLLSHVTPWKRILVFLAGPAVNIVLGVGILAASFTLIPVQVPTTQIASTNECVEVEDPNVVTPPCAASEAGILAGDILVGIDDGEIRENSDITPLLNGKESVIVTVDRSGETLSYPVELQNERMGVTLTSDEIYRTYGQSFSAIGEIMVLNVEAILDLPSKLPGVVASIFGAEKDPEAPSSIVYVGKTYGDVSTDMTISTPDKFETLVLYSGLFNLGLGLINLLPIPPLDGGRILIALMDTVKMAWSKTLRRQYHPVSNKTVGYMVAFTGTAVFGFMALLIISDIVQISKGAM